MKGRRTALGISLLLLVGAGVLFLFFPVKQPGMEANYIDARAAEELLSGRTATEADILTELYFAEESLPRDKEYGIFYLPVDMDTEQWEAGSFYTGDPGVEVYLTENPLEEVKSEAVKSGKEYRLLAVGEDAYRWYAVVFTGLPVLSLQTPGEIRYEEMYGEMRFYQADTKKDWVMDSLMSGHIRGGSSRLNPKKSYKMTLYKQNQTGSGSLRENQVSLLGMREDDEWLLYCIYSEDSKVRDKLSLDIWNDSGALEIEGGGHYGYHMEYIEVFVNDSYHGIYGLMEPVDYKQLDLTKEGEAQPEDYLYKQKDPGVFELKGSHAAVDEEHMKRINAYQAYLNAEDSVFAEVMPQLIDVDSALEVWIYLQAVLGMDNIERNIFYPTRYEDGEYRMYFMPWDMDYTWGNVHDFDELNRTRFSEEILTMRIAWKLGDRLVALDVEGAQEKVAKRWKELRKTVYSDAYLTEHIDEYAHSVADSGAFARDESRWVLGGHCADYEALKTLVRNRMEFLDSYMEDPLTYLELEAYVE